MKNIKFQNFALLALALGLTANLIVSCNFKEIGDGLNIYLRSDVLLNPLSIEFADARAGNPAVPFDKIKITVLGPAADKIYSPVGERKLKLDGPYLNLGIRRIDAPSLAKPLYFAIRATLNGYIESTRWYSITDGEGFRLEKQLMVNEDLPPAGVSVLHVTLQTSATTGTDKEYVLKTPLTQGTTTPQKISFTIPAGTKLFAADDPSKALDGPVRAVIAHFDPSTAVDFPTGPHTPYTLDSNGKPRKPGSSIPAGYTSVSLTQANTPVGSFSAPMNATLVLSGNEENAQGVKIAANDQIPVWSLKEPSMAWQEESSTTVNLVGSELACSWTMPHLSTWAAGWFPPAPNYQQGYEEPQGSGNWIPPVQPTVLQVSSNIAANNLCQTGGGYFYTEVRDAARGNLLLSDYAQYYNGRKINISSLMSSIPAAGFIWRIFKGPACSPGTPLYESPVLHAGETALPIGNVFPTNDLQVNFAMEGTCGTGSVIIPTAPVHFRHAGTDCFQELGVLHLGEGCTGNLYKGEKYDFAIYYGGLERIIDGITIPQQDSTFVFNTLGFNDTLNIRYTGGGNVLTLDYRHVKIPDDLCEEFKKYFF